MKANLGKSIRRIGAALGRLVPKHEHRVRETLHVDIYYPDHEERSESSVFRDTKEAGHTQGLRCAFSGQPSPEYHHLFIEWADTNAVDWELVKQIGTGEVKRLPVLHPKTDQPTTETYPAEHSWVWLVCKIAELRGFDWKSFDPNQPEQFVDSMANMLPLSEKFHRHKYFGIHMIPFPMLAVMGLPRVPGFVFSTKEEG